VTYGNLLLLRLRYKDFAPIMLQNVKDKRERVSKNLDTRSLFFSFANGPLWRSVAMLSHVTASIHEPGGDRRLSAWNFCCVLTFKISGVRIESMLASLISPRNGEVSYYLHTTAVLT
jgi:hypothetical protein